MIWSQVINEKNCTKQFHFRHRPHKWSKKYLQVQLDISGHHFIIGNLRNFLYLLKVNKKIEMILLLSRNISMFPTFHSDKLSKMGIFLCIDIQIELWRLFVYHCENLKFETTFHFPSLKKWLKDWKKTKSKKDTKSEKGGCFSPDFPSFFSISSVDL